jgi:hypothetical protein
VKRELSERKRNEILVKVEKQFRKDSGVVFKWIVGQEDYSWFNEWLIKNKEKEIEEAEKRHKTRHVKKLKEMSVEDYLFYCFNNPEIEGRLRKEMKPKSEEAERLSFILGKLKAEYLRLQRTRI